MWFKERAELGSNRKCTCSDLSTFLP
jgi:hypothetical protein